ncbi:MAG: cadherin repeat domain-containing protein [Pirellulales bacterium]
MTLAENAGANATIGEFTSSDPDAGSTFTYSLVAGTGDTDNDAFNIQGSTLRATNSFNFETKSSYLFENPVDGSRWAVH